MLYAALPGLVCTITWHTYRAGMGLFVLLDRVKKCVSVGTVGSKVSSRVKKC